MAPPFPPPWSFHDGPDQPCPAHLLLQELFQEPRQGLGPPSHGLIVKGFVKGLDDLCCHRKKIARWPVNGGEAELTTDSDATLPS